MSDSRLDLNRHGLCAGRAQLQCARFERPLQAEALTWTCLDEPEALGALISTHAEMDQLTFMGQAHAPRIH